MDFFTAIIYPSYWFTHQHPVPDRWVYVLAVLFGLLMLAGLTTALLSLRRNLIAPMRTLLKKSASFGLTMGVIGYCLLFFSVQRIAFFSVRLTYLLWAIGAVIWLYSVLHYAFRVLPKRVAERQERERREKYLPKASR
jgi:hypothetical protein